MLNLLSLIAVKVLGDNPLSGPWLDVISGINWAAGQARISGRPSIISISISGGANDAVDQAVNAAISQGIHAVVAAGNGNENAFVVALGESNFGMFVDIMAPGQDAISAWSTSDTATAVDSGTSMATPHVTGVVAYIISKVGNMNPGAMRVQIMNTGLKGALVDNPVPNNILHNII
ncbi:peptidase S8/S53 domain-containing protein [Flagelloscypha sp. PMI_526]|nr:peptidase S8/S53 domain-containing protein [Flagelloscypha sp. PMI_526]